MNDKMVMAIAKVVGKEVEIKTAEQDGKNIIVTAVAGDETYKAVLSERKNQYGTYYRVMSSEVVEVADEEPKEDVDEVEAIANLEAAKKFSEQKNAPVYVMSNGKEQQLSRRTQIRLVTRNTDTGWQQFLKMEYRYQHNEHRMKAGAVIAPAHFI